MPKEPRLLSRSDFAKRLGLYEKDLTRRPCGAVADTITCFYDLDGNLLAEHHVKHSPVMPWDDETYMIYVDDLSDHPAQERICV